MALGLETGQVLEEELHGARQHAGALVPLLERLLERADITLDDVRGVLLSDGPGSFTGLRVGAAVAKALAHARGLAVATAPSLMVRAAPHGADGATVLAVSNALRGEVYAATYRFASRRVETVRPASVWKPEALAASGPAPDVVVGDAPPEAIEVLEAWSGHRVVGLPAAWPRAALLFDLRRRDGGAAVIADVERWEPEYGRPAEAQARWEQAHGRPLPDPARDAG
ncbi:MAG: tRNA (adenosine(37)-N6)-threonylcarbamoyltransferase complex dimerization subunit type 1 TsaB [Gemmatimonadales bacterium]